MSERYGEIKRIFLLACGLEGEARRNLLDRECGDDPELRRGVETLLARDIADGEASTRPTPHARSTIAVRRDKLPERIGRCRILHELGSGGMGVVYVGVLEEGEFQRRVAVKVLKKGMDTDDVLRRFQLERQVLASLNHPNIGRLYDAGETDDGRPYFIMELVEGQPLDEYCDTQRLTIGQRLELFRSVCAAVQAAHQNLVVHRDLKPGNIMVTQEGVPKLLDFGIAKLVNPDLASPGGALTRPDARFMTPEYASPEQIRGQPISTASDVYSLGVLLYELLCGHRPYKLKSRLQKEVERVVCEEEPERPSTAAAMIEEISDRGPAGEATTRTITPQTVCRSRGDTRPERLRRRLTGDIDNIVMKAMRKAPGRRYASAEQLGEDIRRHLSNETVTARPPHLAYRSSRFVRRHPAGVAAAGLGLAVIALAIIALVASLQNVAVRAQRDAVQARAREAEARETVERERADAESLRAETREREVRQLVQTLLTDLHDAVETLPNAVEARALIVETARSHLDRIAAETTDPSAALLVELAGAYDRLGEVQFSVRNPSRGQIEAAALNYERAIEMAETAMSADPSSVAAGRRRAQSQLNMGKTLEARGEQDTAMELWLEALESVRRMLVDHPRDAGLRRDLGVSLNTVGAGHAEQGRDDLAESFYEESLAVSRALHSEHPRDLRVLRDLSVVLNRIGRVRHRAGDPESGLAYLLESLEIREDLARRDPDRNRSERDLAVVHRLLADTYQAVDDLAEARQHLDSYVQAIERLAALSPTDYRAQRDLSMAVQMFGDFLFDRGDYADALVIYERYRDESGTLVRRFPTILEAHRLAAAAHHRVGDGLAATGRSDDARSSYERAENELGRLLEQRPDHTGLLADRASVRRALARLAERQ